MTLNCKGFADDEDESVPDTGRGQIKPATAVVICVISSWESLDNPAEPEEDVSVEDEDVVGELEAWTVSSAISHVPDIRQINTK